MLDPSKYKTSDLYFSAFLRVAGVKFLESVKEEGRFFFVFENSEGIRDLKREYFNRTAKVSALDYADEIRNMKAMLHL